ncbi:hypothetical protein H4R20_006299 [Coemansia guatemalensis]|uniref:Uncharacterized protein n=1 Tax=Coemansia guatemalensis TaxID=2761395 RepID=A0A9W8LPZ9_9FUNG|nr:hypothetical protein H4R20_006299 [Coemansia guatemalensis]
MEKEILRLYQERIDKYDDIFREVSRELDQLKVSQRELTEMQWENNRLAAEATELRADAADMHNALIKERQSHLEVVAENDRLRVREHELERRVKLLANVSACYYKDQELPAASDNRRSSPPPSPSTNATIRPPQKRQRQHSHSALSPGEEDMSKDEYERRQLEIENEALQLSIETMRIQQQEQKSNYTEIIEGLVAELKAYKDSSSSEAADKTRRIEHLESELARIKGLYRENLRDLVVARKTALESKHSVKQDSLVLRSEILALQRRLDAEMERSRFLHATSTATPSDMSPRE